MALTDEDCDVISYVRTAYLRVVWIPHKGSQHSVRHTLHIGTPTSGKQKQNGQSVTLRTHLRLMPRLWMHGALPHAFMTRSSSLTTRSTVRTATLAFKNPAFRPHNQYSSNSMYVSSSNWLGFLTETQDFLWARNWISHMQATSSLQMVQERHKFNAWMVAYRQSHQMARLQLSIKTPCRVRVTRLIPIDIWHPLPTQSRVSSYFYEAHTTTSTKKSSSSIISWSLEGFTNFPMI